MTRQRNNPKRVEAPAEGAPLISAPDEEVVDETVEETIPEQVEVTNLQPVQVYVPFAGETLRVGRKESIVVLAADITEETRALETRGRIVIRNL